MDLISILGLGGIVVSSGAMFWPQLKKLVPNLRSSSSLLPHEAVEKLINYFKEKGNKEGLKAATECGKLLYDAMAGDK